MDTLDGINNSNIDEFLEQALDRIAAGEPLDAVVNSFPQDHQQELNSLLSFTDALEEVAREPIPLPSTSRRVSAKQNFLQAAVLEHDQQRADALSVQESSLPETATSDIQRTSESTISDASARSRPVRKLVEREEPGFFARLGSIFSTPAARLAPVAFALLVLFGGGWLVASDSYPGSLGFGLKQTARTVGNALVPEASRNNVLIEQGEAKQEEIERTKEMVAAEDVDVEWRDTAVVVAIEENPDGASYNINTTLGEFTVTEGEAVDVIRLELKEGRLGEGAEIRADLLIQAEKPQQVQVTEVEVIAPPNPERAEVVATVVATQAAAAPVVVSDDTCVRSIPSDWQPHTVTDGETLTQLAIRARSSYTDLARINCISDPNLISTGSVIYLPPASFVAPVVANTPTALPTVTIVPTIINQTPTDVPTLTTDVTPDQINTPIPVAPTQTDLDSTITLTVTSAPTEPILTATIAPVTVEPSTIISTPTVISTVVLTVTGTTGTEITETEVTETEATDTETTDTEPTDSEPTDENPTTAPITVTIPTTPTITVPVTVTVPSTSDGSSPGNAEESDADEAEEATASPVPTATGEDTSTITITVPLSVTVISEDGAPTDAATPTAETSTDETSTDETPTDAPTAVPITVTVVVTTPALEGASVDPTLDPTPDPTLTPEAIAPTAIPTETTSVEVELVEPGTAPPEEVDTGTESTTDENGTENAGTENASDGTTEQTEGAPPIAITVVPTVTVTVVPETDSTGGESLEPSEPTESQVTDDEAGDAQTEAEGAIEITPPPTLVIATPVIATATITPIVTLDTRTSVPTELNEPPAGQATEPVVPAEISPEPISVETVSQPPAESTVPEPATAEPATDEPATDEPATDEPATDEAGAGETNAGETSAGETNTDSAEDAIIVPVPSPIPVAPTAVLNTEPTAITIVTPQVVVPVVVTTEPDSDPPIQVDAEPVDAEPIQIEPVEQPPAPEVQSEDPVAAPTATAIPVSTVIPTAVPPTIAPPPTAVPPTPTVFVPPTLPPPPTAVPPTPTVFVPPTLPPPPTVAPAQPAQPVSPLGP